MLEIYGEKIKRDGQEVGYIEGNYIYDHSYNKVGYVDGNYLHDMNGNKVAYIEGEYLYSYASRDNKTELDTVNATIKGGELSELMRCAVYQFIGA
jgi:hypothetical protein